MCGVVWCGEVCFSVICVVRVRYGVFSFSIAHKGGHFLGLAHMLGASN